MATTGLLSNSTPGLDRASKLVVDGRHHLSNQYPTSPRPTAKLPAPQQTRRFLFHLHTGLQSPYGQSMAEGAACATSGFQQGFGSHTGRLDLTPDSTRERKTGKKTCLQLKALLNGRSSQSKS